MKKLLFISGILSLMLFSCSKPYRIVQIADAQLGFTAAEKSAREGTEYVNDLTYETECLQKAVQLVNDIMPDAVVFTGDQVNFADNTEQWDKFAEIISAIDSSITILHIPGNHDVYIKDCKVDSSPFTSRYGNDCFLHVDDGVRLVGINTNLIKSCDYSEGRQLEWLDKALKKDSPSQVTVLFGHHPFFLEEIDEADSYFPVMKGKRRFYFDKFADMDVDAVYAGHRHESYEGEYRGIPMKTTTSVAFQIGNSQPSVRLITINKGEVEDELLTL